MRENFIVLDRETKELFGGQKVYLLNATPNRNLAIGYRPMAEDKNENESLTNDGYYVHVYQDGKVNIGCHTFDVEYARAIIKAYEELQ